MNAIIDVKPGRPVGLDSRFRLVRDASLALAAPLAPEDYVIQSMPDASPVKWHLAHTTWFFEEFVLQHALPGYRFHDDQFRFLFNSYYNSVGPMHSRPQRGLLSRPTVGQVMEYRKRIDARMSELLQRQTLSRELRDVVILGLNHEQQHQELLLTDIKHLFSCNPLLPAYTREKIAPARAAAALEFQRFEGGLLEIGHGGDGFCFDNEQPRHRTYTDAFSLANRMVTNGEFLEFVRAGGYQEPAHWLSDGWATVQAQGWQRPIYWTPDLEQEFTLTGLRELNPHSPACHLSYYEADAFSRWAGARLPSEVEWELACDDMAIRGNFVENGRWHPEAPPPNKGLLQMFGDVWEWTRSAYAPYPGFTAATGALGEYNGKFMVNQLVLRGGSCATPLSHIRATYRNFFNPAARWQFTGARLARDV
ncbi:MAG: ergothioneine biosynthesis protein EgtB [Proteobacteria bacterium]|nr:ergothioneine biosynthesis protein EgtB [Pseudomonadota bacterium]